MAPHEEWARRFNELQGQVLRHYGVEATSRYIDLARPAIRAHVLEVGTGEPALILHGGDGEAVNWAPLMAVLKDRLHMYAVDRPGFGLTDAFDYRNVDLRSHASDFVSSVLDALGLESVTLMGGSMGGFFCLSAALDRRTRVRNLVLVGMVVGVSAAASLPLRILCGIPGAARLLLKRTATVQGQRAQYRHEFHIDPDTIPEVYFRERAAGIQKPGAAETFAYLMRLVGGLGGIRPGFYLADDLARLDCPTLFVWGEKDDLAPIADGRAVSARMPNSTFVTLDGVGHFPFLEAPTKTAALICDFLGHAGREGNTGGIPDTSSRPR
jgi:pimeloyl-ACP methyl ester carboxylesterase